jgi:hypothetical protein
MTDRPLTDEEVRMGYASDDGRYSPDDGHRFDLWLADVRAKAWRFTDEQVVAAAAALDGWANAPARLAIARAVLEAARDAA